jgi:DNA polymerase family A
VLRTLAKVDSTIAAFYELHSIVSGMKTFDLEVGQDGRNRSALMPWGTKTARNAPSSTRFVYGNSCWMRSLIEPPPGIGLIYHDFEQQEFACAAVFSCDPAMLQAYRSGDPYLAFAKQAGIIPSNATKLSHPIERDRCKVAILGILYGMGAAALAGYVGCSVEMAKELLRHFWRVYHVFGRWCESVCLEASASNSQQTVFGWKRQFLNGERLRPTSVRNFYMQANASEMLRLSCCYAVQAGVELCAPLHDATLVQSSIENLESSIRTMKACMERASRDVLRGFTLRTEDKPILPGEHFCDKRGEKMWNEISDFFGWNGHGRNTRQF